MADDQPIDASPPPEAEEVTQPVEDDGAVLEEDPTDWSSWSNLWQVPTLVVSAGLIGFGIYLASSRAPENDFDAALAQVDGLIEQQQFDMARERLLEVIEPNLDEGLPVHRGHFHASVADWMLAAQHAAGTANLETNRQAIDHYEKAAGHGFPLDPARLERWAIAAIDAGRPDIARLRLDELDVKDISGEAGPLLRDRRNRVLRRLIEANLERPGLEYGELMAILEDYREDDRLSVPDQTWAIGRQAELRLGAERTQEAVDQLLVEMRRLEMQDAPASVFGELYALLGNGYYDLGNLDYAKFNLERAHERLSESDPFSGRVAYLRGVIAVAERELEQAHEQFDYVIRHFVGTPSYVPGLLGRAEIFSKIGRHAEAQSDYRELQRLLAINPDAGRITPIRVAQSLVDRHDSAIVMRDLELALEYARIAETFFTPDEVPPDVLHRVAMTSRQQADDFMTQIEAETESMDELVKPDPAIRAAAGQTYRQAADYFVRHARAVRLLPNEEDAWAESLWMAADSFDRAGLYHDAIEHFREYIGGRGDEARRSEAQYRLAQSFQAILDFAKAAETYEACIEEHPRGPFAYQSHVPLARCYLQINRRPEAEQQLIEVVAGRRHLTPEALEFRDALIELGRLYHDGTDYPKAIVRLQEALDRYPEDPRIPEVEFRLADSYRANALAIAETQASSPTMPKSERIRLERERRSHLTTAQAGFARVVSGFGSRSEQPLSAFEQDLLRNAYLYRADCAFDLGNFDEAIDAYDQAASRYRDHHASMHALIQIYNCYQELGDDDSARNAHKRAQVRLSQLPDDAFNAADALMDRKAWERWLSNSPVGEPVASAETG